MKSLSSFSSPSSCNGCKTLSSASGKQTTVGCISSLLRRILCLRSLSTCPFDYLKEDDDARLLDGSMVGSSGGTIPGVVARLMGLESLPSRDFKKLKSRRVRRGWIIPITYQEAEDDNFFIFSFEDDVLRSKRKNTVRRIDSTGCKSRKTESKISCELVEDMSENTSPGSALEFVGFPTPHHQQASSSSSFSSSGDVSRLRNSRMRRTLSEELDRCDTSKDTRGVSTSGFVGGGRRKQKQRWDEIETEVMELIWVEDEIYRNCNYLKEIGRDVSSQILGHLLDELISTLDLLVCL